MIDIKSLKDPSGLIENLYTMLYSIKKELEKRILESDCYYPTQDDGMNRRELDAIKTIIKYIETYDDKHHQE